MTQTTDIFAKKMAAKLINCGERYNALRTVLVEIVNDATLGESTLRPTLIETAERVLAANPIAYVDGNSRKATAALLDSINTALKIPRCEECGAAEPEAFGHWDYCSQNTVEP